MQTRLATPDLSWETNLNFNVGLDFGIFNNRINGTIEYFNRASKDLLFSRDLIPSSGFGSIDSNIGKPKLSGGFQSNLSWKDLSLALAFTYGIGGKIYNNDFTMLMRVNGGNGDSMSKELLNRWTPENTNTDVPCLVQDGTSKFTSSSTRWLVDRSFLRLKTVTLNYNLPKKWLYPLTLKEVSVFMQGENMLTFSKQQGLDPEQPISGMVSYRYPAMKTISFGINVKL